MDRKHKLKIKPIGTIRKGNLQQLTSAYYSDGSSEDSPDLLMQQKSTRLNRDFQMDENEESGTPRSQARFGKTIKLSKFRDFKACTVELKDPSSYTLIPEKIYPPEDILPILTPQIKRKGPREFVIGKHLGGMNSDSESKRQQAVAVKKDKLAKHPFRHLIFSPFVDEKTFAKHLQVTQRGLVYAKHCLKSPSEKFILQKQVSLPETERKKTENRPKLLLLDLDETLIHACGSREVPSVTIVARAENGETGKIGINVRPNVEYFLTTLSKFYNIYLFTASAPAYATAIVDHLDPQQKYILGILTRGNCLETKNGFFIKDLRILKNQNLKDAIIVDNLAHSFGFQIDNGVPILEWHSDPKDQELIHLTNYLVEASKHDDLRVFNRQRLRLDELADYPLDQV